MLDNKLDANLHVKIRKFAESQIDWTENQEKETSIFDIRDQIYEQIQKNLTSILKIIIKPFDTSSKERKQQYQNQKKFMHQKLQNKIVNLFEESFNKKTSTQNFNDLYDKHPNYDFKDFFNSLTKYLNKKLEKLTDKLKRDSHDIEDEYKLFQYETKGLRQDLDESDLIDQKYELLKSRVMNHHHPQEMNDHLINLLTETSDYLVSGEYKKQEFWREWVPEKVEKVRVVPNPSDNTQFSYKNGMWINKKKKYVKNNLSSLEFKQQEKNKSRDQCINLLKMQNDEKIQERLKKETANNSIQNKLLKLLDKKIERKPSENKPSNTIEKTKLSFNKRLSEHDRQNSIFSRMDESIDTEVQNKNTAMQKRSDIQNNFFQYRMKLTQDPLQNDRISTNVTETLDLNFTKLNAKNQFKEKRTKKQLNQRYNTDF